MANCSYGREPKNNLRNYGAPKLRHDNVWSWTKHVISSSGENDYHDYVLLLSRHICLCTRFYGTCLARPGHKQKVLFIGFSNKQLLQQAQVVPNRAIAGCNSFVPDILYIIYISFFLCSEHHLPYLSCDIRGDFGYVPCV